MRERELNARLCAARIGHLLEVLKRCEKKLREDQGPLSGGGDGGGGGGGGGGGPCGHAEELVVPLSNGDSGDEDMLSPGVAASINQTKV